MSEVGAPTDALTEITLREVTANTVRAVCELRVDPDQVGSMATTSPARYSVTRRGIRRAERRLDSRGILRSERVVPRHLRGGHARRLHNA